MGVSEFEGNALVISLLALFFIPIYLIAGRHVLSKLCGSDFWDAMYYFCCCEPVPIDEGDYADETNKAGHASKASGTTIPNLMERRKLKLINR